MPELPEVEAYKKYIEEALYESPVVKVDLLREKVLKTPLAQFRTSVEGKRFKSSKRIGKYLFLQLENQQWILFHFGMTGKPEYYQEEALQPKHSRLVFHFENGLKLAYVCIRMFGRVELVQSIDQYQKDNKLGEDATTVSFEDFYQYIKDRKAAIKTVLLQQKGFAGIGNWIADEMLFQAKIHPEVKAYKLTKNKIELIYDKMQEVLQAALKVDANYHQFPKHFMVIERWGEGNCPICGEEMKRIVVGGRGTYLCENEQNK